MTKPIADPFLNLVPDDTPKGFPFDDVWMEPIGDWYYAIYADSFWRRNKDGQWEKKVES